MRPSDMMRFSEQIERLAFQMPPPNQWTPQFIQIANEMHICAGYQAFVFERMVGAMEQFCAAYKDGTTGPEMLEYFEDIFSGYINDARWNKP